MNKDLNTLLADLKQLLAILMSDKASIEVVQNKLSISANKAAVLQKLQPLHIADVNDFLDYSGFPVTKVLLRNIYQRWIEPDQVDENFIVLDPDGSAVLYYEKEFYHIAADKWLIEVKNLVSYYQLYNYLKSAEFADHHNSAIEEIIIYNSARGILKIKYANPAPLFSVPIQKSVEKLLEALKDLQFRNYFKNSLFDVANGNVIELVEIIHAYQVILSTARRDQEIAIRQFDFQKFRDALYNQKDKFFVDIRDLISKIFAQMIGIPIAITAAVYTTYKTEHNTTVSLLILVSFMVYVIMYVFIQLTYYRDIQSIKSDFLRDFNIIQTKSGLPEAIITEEYNKVDRKILTTSRIAIILIAAVCILGLAVVVFILTQL